MLALLGARFCLVLWSICHEIEQLHLPIYRIRRKALLGSCTIGTSPLSMRWWILVACTPTSPITVSARTCQQWQVPLWSWILRTRRVDSRRATYELHGVAANGLTKCMLCMLCIYVFKKRRNCGWRRDNKSIPKLFSLLFIHKFHSRSKR